MFFIIDGVTAAGKSRVLGSLHKFLVINYPKTTKLFISEHFTQRNFEHLRDHGTLSLSDVKENINSTLSTLEGFCKKLTHSKFARKDNLLQGSIERFYLTYLVEGLIDLELATEVASSLDSIRCCQVILTIPQHLIEEKVFSTLKYRNQEWHDYLVSLGSRKQVIQHFTEWQERLLFYAQKMEGKIPTLYLDTAEEDWAALAKVISHSMVKEKQSM